MDWFKRFADETNWDKEQIKLENLFNKEQLNNSYDYRFLTESPLIGLQKIKNSLYNIEKDIDQKLSIIQHITDYYRQSKNTKINIGMLVTAITTLLFIIYPQWASKAAELIGIIVSWLLNFVTIIS